MNNCVLQSYKTKTAEKQPEGLHTSGWRCCIQILPFEDYSALSQRHLTSKIIKEKEEGEIQN
jgi:hypothetical protein